MPMEGDQYDQIGRLNDLRAQGALTEEEFGEAKARLLQTVGPTVAVAATVPASAAVATVGPMYTMGRLANSWDPKLRDESRAQGLFFHSYPVWVMVLLTIFTAGIYAYFWLNHWHGVMPKRRNDDPSTARAIWFGLCHSGTFIGNSNLSYAYRRGLTKNSPRPVAMSASRKNSSAGC